MLDFSMADDVPPLDGESAEGNLSQPAMPLRVSSTDALRLPGSAKARLPCGGEDSPH